MSDTTDVTMLDIGRIREIWDKALVDKTITKALYEEDRFIGFFLNDGTKVTYDPVRGLEVLIDPETGDTIRYN